MELQLIIENPNLLKSPKVAFEIHCANFRQLYDVISWIGGCTKFYQLREEYQEELTF